MADTMSAEAYPAGPAAGSSTPSAAAGSASSPAMRPAALSVGASGSGSSPSGGGAGQRSASTATSPTSPTAGGGGGGDDGIPWECIEEMQRGAPLCKFGRFGDPHYRQFTLSADTKYLTWFSDKKGPGSSKVTLRLCTLRTGQTTGVFKRRARDEFENLAFSLIYNDEKGTERSLDLVCKDTKEFHTWVTGLRYLTNNVITDAVVAARQAANTVSAATATLKSDDTNITRNLQQSMADTNDVYAWGWNAWGQLGQGEMDDASAPRRAPCLVSILLGKGVLQVSCGADHTGAVTVGGELYMWGKGACGRLGLGTSENVATPTPVAPPEAAGRAHWAFVACGDMHTLALTEIGSLFSFGAGANGQLGTGRMLDSLLPQAVVEPKANTRISRTFAARSYSACVLENGTLYTWGTGNHGVLGHGNLDDVLVPTQVSALRTARLVSVACGDAHMGVVTDCNELYMWGWGAVGQLGLGDTADRNVPTLVESLGARVASVACGAAHTMAVIYGDETESCLYGWGAASVGQQVMKDDEEAAHHNASAVGGRNAPAFMVLQPRPVPSMVGLGISSVACGAYHTAVLSEAGGAGVLYMAGDGRWGQLGISNTISTPVLDTREGRKRSGSTANTVTVEAPINDTLAIGPVIVSGLDNKQIRSVSCGGRHTCITVATAWIHDEETSTCMRCSVPFTTLNRRHHCRNCGGIFCGKCSRQRIPILKLGFIDPVRVCDGCFTRLQRA